MLDSKKWWLVKRFHFHYERYKEKCIINLISVFQRLIALIYSAWLWSPLAFSRDLQENYEDYLVVKEQKMNIKGISSKKTIENLEEEASGRVIYIRPNIREAVPAAEIRLLAKNICIASVIYFFLWVISSR